MERWGVRHTQLALLALALAGMQAMRSLLAAYMLNPCTCASCMLVTASAADFR